MDASQKNVRCTKTIELVLLLLLLETPLSWTSSIIQLLQKKFHIHTQIWQDFVLLEWAGEKMVSDYSKCRWNDVFSIFI